jgi:hypothetical protein
VAGTYLEKIGGKLFKERRNSATTIIADMGLIVPAKNL